MSFFSPFDADEKKVIEQLSKGYVSASMKVVGRGTLTKSVSETRRSPNARKLERALESLKLNRV